MLTTFLKELVRLHTACIFTTDLWPTEILEHDAKNFDQLGGNLKKKMW